MSKRKRALKKIHQQVHREEVAREKKRLAVERVLLYRCSHFPNIVFVHFPERPVSVPPPEISCEGRCTECLPDHKAVFLGAYTPEPEKKLRCRVDECNCVIDCSGPDRCSHCGHPHVHPDTGPCPIHPDAPGDL